MEETFYVMHGVYDTLFHKIVKSEAKLFVEKGATMTKSVESFSDKELVSNLKD